MSANRAVLGIDVSADAGICIGIGTLMAQKTTRSDTVCIDCINRLYSFAFEWNDAPESGSSI